MDIQAWGALGELVGAIAVVVSLIYLASQVRAAGRIAHVQAHQAVTQNGIRLMEFQASEADVWIRGLTTPATLDAREAARFQAILYAFLMQLADLWHAHRNETFDEPIFERWLTAVASILNTPGGSRWWNQARPLFVPELVEALDRRRAKTPPWTEMHSSWFEAQGHKG